MLKPDKRCKVCQTFKSDKGLIERIANSKAYIKGGESLREISRDYLDKFEYQSLYKHTKNHQGLSEEDLERKLIVNQAKKIEAAQLREAVKHHELRDELLTLGTEGIREGEIKMRASDVVSLLKQKADIEDKAKDREMDYARMIQDFASGAHTEVIEGEVVE